MAREIKISETQPFDDAVFLIRVECVQKSPAHVRLRNIQTIMEALQDTVDAVRAKNPVALQNWPTGAEE